MAPVKSSVISIISFIFWCSISPIVVTIVIFPWSFSMIPILVPLIPGLGGQSPILVGDFWLRDGEFADDDSI